MISNDMNLNMIFNFWIKIDRDLQILMSLKNPNFEDFLVIDQKCYDIRWKIHSVKFVAITCWKLILKRKTIFK